MEIIDSPQLKEAIAGLRSNGLFHLNGFLALIDKLPPDKIELSSKTIEILIRVFRKEIELLQDAGQFCMAPDDDQRAREFVECVEHLQVIIEHLSGYVRERGSGPVA